MPSVGVNVNEGTEDASFFATHFLDKGTDISLHESSCRVSEAAPRKFTLETTHPIGPAQRNAFQMTHRNKTVMSQPLTSSPRKLDLLVTGHRAPSPAMPRPRQEPLFSTPFQSEPRSRTQLILGSNPQMRDWENLELMRLRRLKLPVERHGEHYGIFKKHVVEREKSCMEEMMLSAREQSFNLGDHQEGISPRNDMAPFTTEGKPTCGYFFTRQIDHRKPKLGIGYVDMVKWRSQQKKKHM